MKKRLCFLLLLGALLALLGVSASAEQYNSAYADRNYENAPNMTVVDGVVYHLVDNIRSWDLFPEASRTERTPIPYYEVVDYFDSMERANTAKDISLVAEIDGVPVKQIDLFRFGKESFANVKKITIPEGIVSIGGYSFSTLDGVKEIVLPQSVRFVQWQAFAGMNNLRAVTLPENGVAVSAEAFKNCKKLETVGWSANCAVIPDACFVGCKSLKTVTGGKSVTRIGYGAFQSCAGLESVETSARLERVDASAFKNCNKLKTLSAKNAVYINNYAFYNCEQLDFRPSYATTYVGDHAFTNSGVKTAYLGNAAMEGDSTFKGCRQLLTVYFDAVPYAVVPPKAFANCKALKSVVLPAGGKYVEIGARAFQNCTALKSVSFCVNGQVSEYTVNAIDGRAFQNCTALETITLPPYITDAKLMAFTGCTALKKVRIPQADETKISNLTFLKKLPQTVKVVVLNDTIKAAVQAVGFQGKIQINPKMATTYGWAW